MIMCDKCNGDKWLYVGCCSGFECGCMGLPIGIKPCDKCNENGEQEPSKSMQEDECFKHMEDLSK